MLRSLTIAAVSILATAGVFHGARNWTARDSGASPSVDGSAKLLPALAPAAAPAQTPPESVESQMRRAEVLEGLAKYHRLMLAAEGNEAGIGNRASAAPAPPKAEDSPSPVSPAERRAPPTQPPDRLHWQDPGYLAR